jgi:F-type H+-transporting ATPase subunit b
MGLLTPNPGLFVWTLVAFLLVLFILKKYAWKPILNSLDEREKSIADSLSAAEKARNEMATLKNENEMLLQKAREERTQMLREAKEAADKVVTDAQVAITQQKNVALSEVKSQIGNLVVEATEKILRRQLSDKAAEENYIAGLVKDVNLN